MVACFKEKLMKSTFTLLSLPKVPLKILVVDSEAGIRQILRKAFKIEGYQPTKGVMASGPSNYLKPFSPI